MQCGVSRQGRASGLHAVPARPRHHSNRPGGIVTTSAPLVSPLAVTQPSRWTAIDFGRVSRTPPTEALADSLEAEIWRIAGRLPPTLADDAARVLRGYPGPGRRFIDLFYQPVWSVLHW